MTKHKSEDYKLSAVKYFLENKDTQENTCRIFNCSVRSLLRWTKRYEDENPLTLFVCISTLSIINSLPIGISAIVSNSEFIPKEVPSSK